MPIPIVPAPVALQRTVGHGRISVKASAGRTRIDRLYQQGAARIRLPDHPGRTGLEAIIINTAGGITGGDELSWQASAGAGTHLTVTTQACEKVYKADASIANVSVKLTLGQASTLHWLPQETILFDKAQLQRSIHADMADDAHLLLVEPVIFGRRAMQETVQTGFWRDRWRIWQGGMLVHGEDVRLSGDIAAYLGSLAGLGQHTALATLALFGNHSEGKLQGVRRLIDRAPDCVGGASFWRVGQSSKLIVRLAGQHGYGLRNLLIPIINHLATGPGSQAAAVPKIWSI